MSLSSRWSPFVSRFTPDPGARGPFPSASPADITRALGMDVPSYIDFLRTAARTSLDRGRLRFLAPDDLARWNGASGWKASWPQWCERLFVFAIDWRGRHMAFDAARIEGREPLVSMLDVATNELFETPVPFADFVSTELVDYPDETTTASAHAEWMRRGGAAPREDQCVGYVQPLVLGGEDVLENMEITDLDVYVTICGQLAERLAGLPEGARIGGVKISE